MNSYLPSMVIDESLTLHTRSIVHIDSDGYRIVSFSGEEPGVRTLDSTVLVITRRNVTPPTRHASEQLSDYAHRLLAALSTAAPGDELRILACSFIIRTI